MDPAASPNSLFPMINDLDLTFVDANGTVRFSNGRTSPDTSNNVEQVTGMARYCEAHFAWSQSCRPSLLSDFLHLF
jgi:hypothetical protein